VEPHCPQTTANKAVFLALSHSFARPTTPSSTRRSHHSRSHGTSQPLASGHARVVHRVVHRQEKRVNPHRSIPPLHGATGSARGGATRGEWRTTTATTDAAAAANKKGKRSRSHRNGDSAGYGFPNSKRPREEGGSGSQAPVDYQLSNLKCVICHDLLCEPLSFKCGHSYCKLCIARLTDLGDKKCTFDCLKSKTSPRTQLPLHTHLWHHIQQRFPREAVGNAWILSRMHTLMHDGCPRAWSTLPYCHALCLSCFSKSHLPPSSDGTRQNRRWQSGSRRPTCLIKI
jgi:hypothetical protein